MKTSTKAKANSKAVAKPTVTLRDQAFEVFCSVVGENKRQQVLARFTSELGMKPTTAATYYSHCIDRAELDQVLNTERVALSKAARKYSAVKLVRGSDIAAKVHLFTKKSAAAEFNALVNYDRVVPGIVQVGKAV